MTFATAEQIAKKIDQSGVTRNDILNFIKRFIDANNNGPTITEIGKAIGIIQNRPPLSKSTVYSHLRKLEQLMMLELPSGQPNRIPGRMKLRNSK